MELLVDQQACRHCDWEGELFIQVSGMNDISIRHEGCLYPLGSVAREMLWDEEADEPLESACISRDAAKAMLKELLEDYDREVVEIKKLRRNIVIALHEMGADDAY